MPFSYQEGLSLIERYRAELPGTDAEKDAYIEQFKRLLQRQPEDYRLAVQIAVDASKTLISIGIAFFAAIGAFLVQYSSNHKFSIYLVPFDALCLAAVAALASMTAGFSAIGKAYNRGENLSSRPNTGAAQNDPPWTTKPLQNSLGVQSLAGVVALVLFGVAIIFWDAGSTTGGVAVNPVNPSAPNQSANGSFRLEGEWKSLELRRGSVSIGLGPTPPNQTSTFQVEIH